MGREGRATHAGEVGQVLDAVAALGVGQHDLDGAAEFRVLGHAQPRQAPILAFGQAAQDVEQALLHQRLGQRLGTELRAGQLGQ